MIGLRRYLEAQIRAERERTNLLVAFATAIGLYVFRELERRQKLTEAREEERRRYVDDELRRLSDGELGHRERTQGIQNIGRWLVGAATVVVGVAALASLIASHTI